MEKCNACRFHWVALNGAPCTECGSFDEFTYGTCTTCVNYRYDGENVTCEVEGREPVGMCPDYVDVDGDAY